MHGGTLTVERARVSDDWNSVCRESSALFYCFPSVGQPSVGQCALSESLRLRCLGVVRCTSYPLAPAPAAPWRPTAAAIQAGPAGDLGLRVLASLLSAPPSAAADT
jgi:hypothetical protein